MSWDANDEEIGKAWDTIGTITSIDTANGFPSSFTMRGWTPETYEWNDTNNLIKKRTFEDFEWEYEYYPNTRMVKRLRMWTNNLLITNTIP
ncbi:MAG: hypothetical protein IPJ74_08570 [Saprospiraceae bacterium]|nr:hypothetical protein [Saprospiraceae bacterium]